MRARKTLSGNPAATRKVLALAQQYGPMIATVYPPAGVAIAAAAVLQKKARAGDPDALAKVSAIREGANAGNPTAQASANLLLAVNAVRAKSTGTEG